MAKVARQASIDELALQQRVECDDAAPHITVTMHPAQPSVQITFSSSASEREQQRPRSRCKSSVGTRTARPSPTRRATELAGNDADAPRRVWSPAAVTRQHDVGKNGMSARRLPAGSPDKFSITRSGPGPGVYLLQPHQIGNACLHPPSRSARIGNTKRGSYLEDAINRTKFVPPVGTYQTGALDAGGSGRAMRMSKARRSPSACVPREERVCCMCAAVGPREANVVYDDVRMSAYRTWMG